MSGRSRQCLSGVIVALLAVFVVGSSQARAKPVRPDDLVVERDFAKALARARVEGKLVLLVWNHPCMPSCGGRFEGFVKEPRLRELRDDYVVVWYSDWAGEDTERATPWRDFTGLDLTEGIWPLSNDGVLLARYLDVPEAPARLLGARAVKNQVDVSAEKRRETLRTWDSAARDLVERLRALARAEQAARVSRASPGRAGDPPMPEYAGSTARMVRGRAARLPTSENLEGALVVLRHDGDAETEADLLTYLIDQFPDAPRAWWWRAWRTALPSVAFGWAPWDDVPGAWGMPHTVRAVQRTTPGEGPISVKRSEIDGAFEGLLSQAFLAQDADALAILAFVRAMTHGAHEVAWNADVVEWRAWRAAQRGFRRVATDAGAPSLRNEARLHLAALLATGRQGLPCHGHVHDSEMGRISPLLDAIRKDGPDARASSLVEYYAAWCVPRDRMTSGAVRQGLERLAGRDVWGYLADLCWAEGRRLVWKRGGSQVFSGLNPEYPYAPSGTARVVAKRGSKYKTIAKAVAAADPGDRIVLKPGSYEEEVTVEKNLTFSAPDGGVTWDGGGASALNVEGGEVVLSGITFTSPGEGFTIDVSGGRCYMRECDISADERSCVVVKNGGHVHLLDCRIHDGQAGVYVYAGGTGVVEQCEITRQSMHGIAVRNDSELTVLDCVICDNKQVGAHVNEGARASLEGNILHSNVRGGILVKGSSTVEARDNTIERNRRCGVEIEDGSVLLLGNRIERNGRSGVELSKGKAEIRRNAIRGNKDRGVELRAPTSRAVTIEANRFSGNEDGPSNRSATALRRARNALE